MKCTHEDCDEEVSEGRRRLGYFTSLEHGARAKEFPSAPLFNKGGYQLMTRKDLPDAGRK